MGQAKTDVQSVTGAGGLPCNLDLGRSTAYCPDDWPTGKAALVHVIF